MSSVNSAAKSAGRHRQARERGQVARAAVVAAPVVTAGAVFVGMATAEAATTPPTTASATLTASAGPADRSAGNLVAASREQQPDRSLDRTAAVTAPKVPQYQPNLKLLYPNPKVRYATDDLDIRETSTKDASVVTEISTGTMVKATGPVRNGFSQVLWKGELRWVTTQYLAVERPVVEKAPEALGLSDSPCADGSVENGLTSGAVSVYRAVCHNFPDITTYGGWDAHGEHSSGKAIDIMNPSVDEGYRIAEFLKAHASELGLYDIIWRQHIWTPVRAGEGWRSMPDRGSDTANHYDHVHVSVN